MDEEFNLFFVQRFQEASFLSSFSFEIKVFGHRWRPEEAHCQQFEFRYKLSVTLHGIFILLTDSLLNLRFLTCFKNCFFFRFFPLFSADLDVAVAEGFVYKVSKQSSLAVLIRICKLIIMAKKSAIEALDSLLRDIMDYSTTFGDKVVVFGGDFRQTLPVVWLGSKTQTISSFLTNCYLWPSLTHLQLTENMRALLDPFFSVSF